MENDARIRDEEQLRLLVTFHSVVAALHAVFGVMSLLNVSFGLQLLRADGPFGTDSELPLQEMVAQIAIVGGLVYFVGSLALAVLTFMAGRRLRARRSRPFVLVVAGVNCISFPFGTVLGIFTLVVLNRESVRRKFPT